ncbi:MAG: selenobiotic family radical SAM modification target peptide [Prosthecochloris sp.]|uniref:SbtA family thio(seleno)oxazole RiPP natural product precursor n=1 Tax=Prosthecochloris sp. TaxID=290513 RepID=UPI0013C714DA|nr:SbtA family thio(seleno)oxazole RiPP natural product precursor [Prosthecochloris sp.]NEX12525.1 selenobiotic family radical SAM modification target peptide [Prosthecochloris sp.]
MDTLNLKKTLAGLSVAGLLTGLTLTGCQQANGSCGASGTKTENVEDESAGSGAGSCGATEDSAAAEEGSSSCSK